MVRGGLTSGMGSGTVRRVYPEIGRGFHPRPHGLHACGAARAPRRGPAGPCAPGGVDSPDGSETPVAFSDPSELWAGRLVFDAEVSERSPVVKGTRVTVRRVVSMVVDGRSWAEVRRRHPELTEADVRACLAYCVEEEGAGTLGTPAVAAS
jgi:uncharacterized protein (DUF433 family)